jgi:hypothetical protein
MSKPGPGEKPTAASIVTIWEHRLKRVFAEIDPEDERPVDGRGRSVVGRIVSELVDLGTTVIGRLVVGADGQVWLERATADAGAAESEAPVSYVAHSIDSFRQAAALHAAALKLAFVPRSRRHEFDSADEAFCRLLREHDPRCLDEPSSYWNELRREEY